MAVVFPKNATAPGNTFPQCVEQHAVTTGEYDADLPFKSLALYVGVGGDVRLWLWGDTTYAASGQVVFGAISGSVGATIDGTLVTVAAASYTTATLAATALSAAINADPDIGLGQVVYATNVYPIDGNAVIAALAQGTVPVGTASNIVTVFYKNPSPDGDAITLVLSGTGVTVSGAVLDGSDGSTLRQNMITGRDYLMRIRQILSDDTAAEGLVIWR